jgi:hypothetical protein
MSKVKKYFLSLDEELEFEVVGITSHQADFKLVWNVNNTLKLHLVKSENDLSVFNEKKDEEIPFPYYHFEDELDRVSYFLLKNKNELDYLVPEAQSIDYFLFLTNNYIIDVNDFIGQLRQVDAVLGVFAFDNQKFKSFQYLEFN